MNITMLECKIEQKMMNPSMHHPFQKELFSFLFNSIECRLITKFFWEYYIKKDYMSPNKLWRNFENIILRYIGFHTIITT
jgi:hypothetical protein